MAINRRDQNILIIEDDTDVQNFISKVLELEGYTVLKAGEGTEGMRLMKENSISLVLLDLRLPGPDGWSILRAIKRHSEYSSIPVVVLTARQDEATRRQAEALGASAFVAKPFKPLDLTVALRIAMSE